MMTAALPNSSGTCALCSNSDRVIARTEQVARIKVATVVVRNQSGTPLLLLSLKMMLEVWILEESISRSKVTVILSPCDGAQHCSVCGIEGLDHRCWARG